MLYYDISCIPGHSPDFMARHACTGWNANNLIVKDRGKQSLKKVMTSVVCEGRQKYFNPALCWAPPISPPHDHACFHCHRHRGNCNGPYAGSPGALILIRT